VLARFGAAIAQRMAYWAAELWRRACSSSGGDHRVIRVARLKEFAECQSLCDVGFLLRWRINASCVEAGFSSMIWLMLAQIRVWIECAACGPCQKLSREVVLPFEVTPMREITGAICDRCRGLAIMCFERKPGHLH